MSPGIPPPQLPKEDWINRQLDAIKSVFLGRGLEGNTPAFFQSRFTQTPGVIDPSLDKHAMEGAYSPGYDPSTVVNWTKGLENPVKNVLMQDFAGKKGMMTISPRFMDDETLRHESYHDLYERSGLEAIAPQLAGFIQPETVRMLGRSPFYSDQMEIRGRFPVLADEGAAYELTEPKRFIGGSPNPELVRRILEHLQSQGKTKERNQFNRLVFAPRGLEGTGGRALK